MDRVYGALKKMLPQQVVIQDTVTVAIPPAIIKKQLAAQAKLTLIFGFMGRVPNRYEVVQWIQGHEVLRMTRMIDNACYLSKGFYSVRFKEESAVSKILEKGQLSFYKKSVCVFPWEPLFSTPASP